MHSIWQTESAGIPENRKEFEHRADVIVIGAGLAGVLTGWFLKQKGLRPLLIEAGEPGCGQTGNTTAKVTCQHGAGLDHLIRTVGLSRAGQYVQANAWAVREYENLIREKRILCDWKQAASCLYTTVDSLRLEREQKAANRLGLSVYLSDRTELPFPVTGALYLKKQGMFSPLKFLDALARELDIMCHTAVLGVEENTVFTERGEFFAEHIVMADHFPFRIRPGYYFMRLYQQRSYVLALRKVQEMEAMYLEAEPNGLSFRAFPGGILFGGCGHRAGKIPEENPYTVLRRKANWFWGTCREEAHWSAQDCMTMDGLPYIGRFSSRYANQYVATGFGKWGMTNSMVAARLISDAVTGEENPWKEAFSPQRFTPRASLPGLIRQTAVSAKNIALRLFEMPQETADTIPKGKGGIIVYRGQKAGAYKDEQGNLYTVSVRCPHLGCELQWNPADRTWDCPCHGSRFDFQGNRIENPAQTDITLSCTCSADD